jgi:hypothetical protein
VTFEIRDDGRRWQIDVTFLTSHWGIFSRGCQGVLYRATPRWCRAAAHYGALLTGDATVIAAKGLSDDEWEYAKAGKSKGHLRSAERRGGRIEWRLVSC